MIRCNYSSLTILCSWQTMTAMLFHHSATCLLQQKHIFGADAILKWAMVTWQSCDTLCNVKFYKFMTYKLYIYPYYCVKTHLQRYACVYIACCYNKTHHIPANRRLLLLLFEACVCFIPSGSADDAWLCKSLLHPTF